MLGMLTRDKNVPIESMHCIKNVEKNFQVRVELSARLQTLARLIGVHGADGTERAVVRERLGGTVPNKI